MKSLPEQINALLSQVEFDPDKVQQSVREGMQVLQQAQLPIGWEHAPWNSSEWPKTDNDSTPEEHGKVWRYWEIIKWIGSVFISGLLVGLGGPFWFDTYRKLAAVTGITKTFQSQVKQEGQAVSARPAAEMIPEQSSERFKRIFNVSRKASNFAKASGRQQLTNDGTAVAMGHIR